ncbi:MAG: hypothetical protein ABI147_07120 [Acidobacteriaceae bacterium]
MKLLEQAEPTLAQGAGMNGEAITTIAFLDTQEYVSTVVPEMQVRNERKYETIIDF